MFSKSEIAGAFVCLFATAVLVVEAYAQYALLEDQWVVAILTIGVGLWLGPKTWSKLRGLSIGPLTFRSDS